MDSSSAADSRGHLGLTINRCGTVPPSRDPTGARPSGRAVPPAGPSRRLANIRIPGGRLCSGVLANRKRGGGVRRWLADRKAEMFARWVRHASDERLGSVMHSPLRGILLWQVFRTICQRFDRARAAKLDAVVEFRIRGRRPGRLDRYQVAVAGGDCATRRRGERTPRSRSRSSRWRSCASSPALSVRPGFS
jgi:hypothetical protein